MKTLYETQLPYQECEIRNSPDCERITCADHCSTTYDGRLCCMNCDPPVGEYELIEVNR
jgi:hypothetical protein